MIRLVFFFLTVLFAAGCTITGGTDQLQARAAYDLKCPAEQVALTQLDVTTFGADGCGSRATYLNVHGRWIMNSTNTAAR